MKYVLLISLILSVFISYSQDSAAYKPQQKNAKDTFEYQDLRETPGEDVNKWSPKKTQRDTFQYEDVREKGASSDAVDSALKSPQAFDPNDTFGLTKKELIAKAREDANTSYGRGGKIFALNICVSLVGGPVVGLAPALACSLTFNEKHANFPHYKLSQNQVYRAEYFKQCRRIKRAMSWGGMLAATVIDSVAAGLTVYFVKTKNLN